jgi:hypothetical protein
MHVSSNLTYMFQYECIYQYLRQVETVWVNKAFVKQFNHTNKLAKAYIHAETVWVDKAFLKQFNHTNKLAKAYIHAYAHTYINAPHAH